MASGLSQIEEGTSRARRLHSSVRYNIDLIYYPPAMEQAPHRHDTAQISFLLAGCFAERSDGREHQPLGRQMGIMPAHVSHAVRFGREGALMLAIDCPAATAGSADRRQWRRFGSEVERRIDNLSGGIFSSDEAVDDLLAVFDCPAPERPPSRRTIPSWLLRAVQIIADRPDISIARLARESGVHRVHMSRGFQRHLGLSPTEFRLQRKCAAAMSRTLSGQVSLADAALAAGFADQAHWTRACRAVAGLPPGRIRSLLVG